MIAFLAVSLLCMRPVSAGLECLTKSGMKAPCGPGVERCAEPFGDDAPQFHVHDATCGINDPNGPFYDAVHGVYHLFYQDHLAQPDDAGLKRRSAVSWGHAVSRDLTYWSHLPVALWNGKTLAHWYDYDSLFTGSTTIVDGKPVIVYPGLCDAYPPTGQFEGCKYGYTFGTAVPAEPSDPLYRNWTKSPWNPIVNDTFDDPSTAWQTKTGEWRMLGHCGDGSVGFCDKGAHAPIWASKDFKSWRFLGFSNMLAGECASLFPLPPLTPGAKGNTSALPTHVHKWGCLPYNDCIEIGFWEDGVGNAPGTWTTTPEMPQGFQLADKGDAYASKDFWDPVKKRRISWAWAEVHPGSAQTLPRVMTYHPVLKQIVWSPAQEQADLRGRVLGQLKEVDLTEGHFQSIGASAQAELLASFKLPSKAATFGVTVMGSNSTNSGYFLYVAYEPPSRLDVSYEVTVGIDRLEGTYSRMMPNSDLTSCDYNSTHMQTTPQECQALCDGDAKCKSWTFAPPSACFRKSCIPGAITSEGITSGVKDPSEVPPPKLKGVTDTLKLLREETTLEIRCFVDQTFTEAYWQGGRVAMTKKTKKTKLSTLDVRSHQGGVHLQQANSWSVKPMWVNPEHVLATGRRDRPEVEVFQV